VALRQLPLRPVLLSLVTTVALLLAPSVASAAWTVTPTPVISGPAKSLLGVDCSSANSCFAVGFVDTGSGTPLPLSPIIEHWDGTSWQRMPTPNQFGSLHGISCPRSNFCFAVGSTSGTLPGRIERWNGTSWSIESGTPDTPTGSLEDVSCSGVLACTAVGSLGTGTIQAPSPNTRTLAERWDATGWHVQSTPNPTGSERNALTDISCPLRRTCTAVGESLTDVGSPGILTGLPFIERWFGRVNAWGQQAVPQPEGAESVGVGGVSCPHGSRVCVAVGGSGPQQGPPSAMAARRIGLRNWSVFPLTTLPGPGSGLSTVNCPTGNFCQATGFWGNGLIAERFDGTNWQVEGIPTPGVSFPRLADVSCPSRFFCMAVGSGQDPTGFGFTLAAKWTP
jgi:hypothetical protein